MSHNQTYSYNHPGYGTYEQSPTTYSIQEMCHRRCTKDILRIQAVQTPIRPYSHPNLLKLKYVQFNQLKLKQHTQLRK